jgi:hypothetical protein
LDVEEKFLPQPGATLATGPHGGARGSTDVGHRCLGRAMKSDRNPDRGCSPRRILNFSHNNSQPSSICDLGHIQWPEPVNMSFRLAAHPCFAEHIRWLLALDIVLGLALVPCPKGAAPMTEARPARSPLGEMSLTLRGVTSPSLAAKTAYRRSQSLGTLSTASGASSIGSAPETRQRSRSAHSALRGPDVARTWAAGCTYCRGSSSIVPLALCAVATQPYWGSTPLALPSASTGWSWQADRWSRTRPRCSMAGEWWSWRGSRGLTGVGARSTDTNLAAPQDLS